MTSKMKHRKYYEITPSIVEQIHEDVFDYGLQIYEHNVIPMWYEELTHARRVPVVVSPDYKRKTRVLAYNIAGKKPSKTSRDRATHYMRRIKEELLAREQAGEAITDKVVYNMMRYIVPAEEKTAEIKHMLITCLMLDGFFKSATFEIADDAIDNLPECKGDCGWEEEHDKIKQGHENSASLRLTASLEPGWISVQAPEKT